MSIRAMVILLAGCLASALALSLAWILYSKPSLEQSLVVVAPTAGVLPPAGRADVLGILYSGDGGWADLDKQLGDTFAARGMPMLGVNVFRYFWRNRSPDEAAAELDAVISRSLRTWHKDRVWLVGYSFGANVLPMLVDRLSPENRSRIAQVVLLAPERDVSFEIQFEDYMKAQGRFRAFAKTLLEKFNKVRRYDAIPPLATLADHVGVVCYYGVEEAAYSLCTDPRLPGRVRVREKSGGHHFAGGYLALATQMLAELPTRQLTGRGG